ncbi:MAG: ABC transporter ATP-binding protein, partial [Candidatus Kariarchaeaceae archaeon]
MSRNLETEEKKIPAVELINAIKIFNESGTNRKVSALRGCDLVIHPGQLVSIIGPSGAGKTTLLRVIAGLEELSSGEVAIAGTSLNEMSATLRQEFRRKYIGTFTQFGRHNFDPSMTVHQAITWETLQAGWPPTEARARTDELLKVLKLEHLRDNACGQLSAGEAMRVSFLKAVAKKPLIILADEPTGQLDSTSMYQLYEVMRQILNEETAIMVATHDVRFQAVSDTSLLILDGKLASEEEGSELLSRRSVYFDKIMQEKPEVSSNLFIDSNNSIRIPDSVIRRLKLG